jgi:hypothetical protein
VAVDAARTAPQAQELSALKKDVASVAEQTVVAISALRQSMAALRQQQMRRGRGERGRGEGRGEGRRSAERGGGNEARSGGDEDERGEGEEREERWTRLRKVQQTHSMLLRLC